MVQEIEKEKKMRYEKEEYNMYLVVEQYNNEEIYTPSLHDIESSLFNARIFCRKKYRDQSCQIDLRRVFVCLLVCT